MMKRTSQCLIVIGVWVVATITYFVTMAFVNKKKDKENQCPTCRIVMWFIVGTVLYTLLVMLVYAFISHKRYPEKEPAKEYLDMSNNMASNPSCKSPREVCEQQAIRKHRGDNAAVDEAIKECQSQSPDSSCVDKLINKCGEMMQQKGPGYFKDLQDFSKTRGPKDTLSLCKNVAESSVVNKKK